MLRRDGVSPHKATTAPRFGQNQRHSWPCGEKRDQEALAADKSASSDPDGCYSYGGEDDFADPDNDDGRGVEGWRRREGVPGVRKKGTGSRCLIIRNAQLLCCCDHRIHIDYRLNGCDSVHFQTSQSEGPTQQPLTPTCQ
jgi:hypothetical protein